MLTDDISILIYDELKEAAKEFLTLHLERIQLVVAIGYNILDLTMYGDNV